MYRCLNASYRRLKDKKGIIKKHLFFPGFNANDEEKELSYVEYLLYNLSKYKEFRKRGKYPDHDSRTPALKKYRAMMLAWNSLSNKKMMDKNEILLVMSGELPEEHLEAAGS